MRKAKERPVSAALTKMIKRNNFTLPKTGFSLQTQAFLFSKEKKIQKVYGGAHRTNISAEEPADDESGSDGDKGPQSPANDLPCRKNSVQTQERIETQVNICRKPIRQLVGGKDKEGGEEEKGEGLEEFPHAFSLKILS